MTTSPLIRLSCLACLVFVSTAVAETPVEQEAAIKALRGWASNIQKNRDGTVRFVRFSKPLVTDEHVAQIAAFKQLDYLAVVTPTISDEGLKHVENLTNLDTLLVSHTKLTDEGVKFFEKLSRLENLYLDETQVSDAGLNSLVKFPNLKVLSLKNLPITDAGIRSLGGLKNLETLVLSDTKITNDSIQVISSLSNLKSVIVDGTRVDDEFVAGLVKLPSLETIDVSRTKVTGTTLANLASLKKLQRVLLMDCRLVSQSISAAKDSMPRVTFETTPAGERSFSAFQRFLARTGTAAPRPQLGEVAKPQPLAAILEPAKERFLSSDSLPDFQRHIIPLLGRLGCNGRSCHGSFQGKGGFRLSMFGYDFAEDHKALTGGEHPRVDVKRPLQSLMLRKPTMQEEHEGGLRFKKDSWQHKVLAKWIAGGANSIGKTAARLVQFEVTPREINFEKKGEKVQLQAVATWSDGTREDVTCLARFQTNNEAMATVNADGLVTCVSPGDTYVVSFYDSGVFSTQVLLPLSDKSGSNFPGVPTPTKIDELVVQKLRKLGIVPSETASDEEFLRRVSLDIAGTLPTAAQVKIFVADQTADKRAKKINELLESPAYVEWWTNLFNDLTGSNAQHLGNTDMNTPAAGQWRAWIRRRVRDNVGWHKIAAGIVLATGRRPGQSYDAFAAEQSTYLRRKSPEDFTAVDNPMHYYWARGNIPTPADKALSFGYIFLGVRLQCAQCHKHPFDQWSKKDFEQFTEFFSRVRFGIAPDALEAHNRLRLKLGVPKKLDTAALRRQMYLRVAAEGLSIPWRETYVLPPREQPHIAKLLGDQEIDLNDYADPREPLMDWLVASKNPYFAKAFVNRIWTHYFGVGIVDPPDDFNMANPPSNKALLEYLAQGFVAHEYDMKWLHRTITNSRTYQLNWRPTDTNRSDTRNFSHSKIRRLPAEVTIDAILRATGSDKSNANLENPKYLERRKIAQHPKSIQARSIDYSLLVFGKPLRTTNCDCERQMQPTLLQSLYVRNDLEMIGWLERPDSWLVALSKELKQPLSLETKPTAATKPESSQAPNVAPSQMNELVNEAYLRTLSRRPKTWELEKARLHLTQAENTVEGLRDLLWVLLNTQEFLTNH